MAIAAFERRRRAVLLAQAFGEALVVEIGALTLVALVDHLAHPAPVTRIALSAGAWIAGGTVLAWRGLIPALVRRDAVVSAQALERAAGGALDERLSSALALATASTSGVSVWMINRTVALAAQAAAAVQPRRLVSSRPARRALYAGAAACVAIGLACLSPTLAALAARAAWPFAGVGRPSMHRITVLPGDAMIAQGARFALAADIAPTPGSALAVLRWDDGLDQELVMAGDPAGGSFRLELPAVTQGFAYQVRVGDGESRSFRVGVRPPPALASLAVRVRPPTYTGLPPRAQAGGDVEVVAGSLVAIQAGFTGDPVAAATLVRDGRDDQALVVLGDGTAGGTEFTPEATQSYGIHMTGASGVSMEAPQRWLVTVRPDAAPTVALDATGPVADLVGAGEVLALAARAGDDLGLRRLDLVVADDRGEIERRGLIEGGSAGTLRAVEQAAVVDLGAYALTLGDRLHLTLEAEDLGGQRVSSAPLVVTVAGDGEAQAAAWAEALTPELVALDTQAAVLRQAEKAWTALARVHRPEDPDAQRGDARLIAARCEEATATCADIARRIRGQALASPLATAPRVLAAAEALARWANLQRSILASAASAAGEPGAGSQALVRCRDLSENALAGLGDRRQALGLQVARLRAGGLVGVCDAAQARAARATPVLRGLYAWRDPSWRPGLDASFFAGIELAGQPLRRTVALPELVAGGRAEDWSARWRGELRADADGEYEFVCTADDGVRLRIAGEEVLPAAAWVTQAPTEYRGRLHLTAGWHRCEIEYFQGGGGSHLALAWGAVGGPHRALDLGHTRCPAISEDAALARAMATASPATGVRALARLVQACTAIAGAPATLRRIGEDAGIDVLHRLAERSDEHAARCAAVAAKADTLVASDLTDLEGRIAAVASAARRARDELDNVAVGEPRSGPLAAERGLAREMKARGEAMRSLDRDLSAADRSAAHRREGAAVEAMFGVLGQRIALRRAELSARAAGASATILERAHALAAREQLATDVVAAVQAAREVLARGESDPRQQGEQLAAAAGRLDKALERAEQGIAQADAARQAQRADQARAEAGAVSAAERVGDARAAAAARARLKRAMTEVVAAERVAGDRADASRLTAAAAVTVDHRSLDKALASVERPREAPALDIQAGRRLAQVAQALDSSRAPQAAGDLHLAALELAVEAERRRPGPAGAEVGAAFSRLAERSAAEAAAPDSARVAGLAREVEAIRTGDAAAIARVLAAPGPPVAPDAGRLDQLAADTERAADDPARRAALAGALAIAAEGAGPPPPADTPRGHEEHADEIERLIARERALAREERVALSDYASRERDAAIAAEAAAREAGSASVAGADPAAARLRATLAAVVDRLAEQAPAARARAERAVDPTVAESPALVAATAAVANAIETDLATPLAEAWRAAAAADPSAPELAPAAAVAGRLVDLATAQRESAARLDRVLARREANRAALARSLATAAESAPIADAPSADPLGLAAARTAQGRAEAAQATASAATRLAAAEVAEAGRPSADPARAAQREAEAAQARVTAFTAQEAALGAQRAALAESAWAGDRALEARAASTLAEAARSARTLAALAAPTAVSPTMSLVASAHVAQAQVTAGATTAAERAAAALRASPPTGSAGQTGAPATGQATAASTAARTAAAALAEIKADPRTAANWRAAAEQLRAGAAQSRLSTFATAMASASTASAGSTTSEPVAAGAVSAAGPGAAPADSEGQRLGDAGEGDATATTVADDSEWGRSRGDLRGDVMASGIETFGEEQQEAIRAYFRRLGADR